jgi:plastocyanin
MKSPIARRALAFPLLLISLAAGCDEGVAGGGGSSGGTRADVVIPQGAQVLGFAAYDPDTLTVHLNGAASVKVVWRNDDRVGATTVDHTVTDTTAANDFSVRVDAGKTASITFVSAGSYPYKCSFHPGMRGLVIVQP